MDISNNADTAKPVESTGTNEAAMKFVEVAKALGCCDETIDCIKKDLKIVDEDSEEEDTEEIKPEAKVVEVSVEKVTPTETKGSPMMDMLKELVKNKTGA